MTPRLLTRDGVHPVSHLVPPVHEGGPVHVHVLHVVNMHVERVLLGPLQVPLLHLAGRHVDEELVRRHEGFATDSFSYEESQCVGLVEVDVDQTLEVVRPEGP